MATTKTLTPTNQAITLADFTEKPDNRTNVTNDDKLADAVNALNSNLGNRPKYSRVTKTIAKGGSQTFLYNEFSFYSSGHASLLTATGSNTWWKYAGILIIDGTRSSINQIFQPAYLTATADSTGVTITNTNNEYDMAVTVEIIGT